MLSKDTGRLGWIELLTILAVALPPAAMVIVQPDLGSGLNILLLLGGMILFRGLTGRVFKVLLVVVPLPFLARRKISPPRRRTACSLRMTSMI